MNPESLSTRDRSAPLARDGAFRHRLRASVRLDEDEVSAFTALLSDPATIAADRMLVAEGEAPTRLHILAGGWAARVKLLADGRRHFSTLLVPGDLCDVDGLHVRRYDYGVMTLTPCSVASVDLAALLELCERYPRIARGLTWLAFVDNSMLIEHATSLARRTGRERVAHLLCELATRLHTVGHAGGDGIERLPSQEKLADACGLTAVHLNRMLRDLRDEDLIVLAHRRLTVLDWKAFRSAGGFSPEYLHLEGIRQSPPS